MEKQTPQPEPQPDASAPEARTTAQAADNSPYERAKERYAGVIGELLADATNNKTHAALSNVMAFNLAWLIVEFGPKAAGHVLESLGSHISSLTERNRAAQEARQAREEGRLPH